VGQRLLPPPPTTNGEPVGLRSFSRLLEQPAGALLSQPIASVADPLPARQAHIEVPDHPKRIEGGLQSVFGGGDPIRS